MTYWVEYMNGWARENLMTDSIVRARRLIYGPLSTRKYGKSALVFSSRYARNPIGMMDVDKVGNIIWHTAKKGIFGKPHLVVPSGEFYN